MNWDFVNLGDICYNIQYGFTASATEYEDGFPKFLRITDIVNDSIEWDKVPYCHIDDFNINKYLLKKGDIVVARTGNTTGYAKLIRNEKFAVFASYLIRYQIDEKKAFSGYVGRIVESNIFKKYVNQIKGGAAQGGANATSLSQFKVPLPPLPTQRRIAEILSAYDDLIENNRRRIRLLEEAARLLYREWFVHFRFPGHQQARWYTDEQGRRLPVGWRWDALGNVCNVTMGQSPSSEYYNDDNQGLPFHQGVTNFGDRFVTHKTYCSIDSRIAQKGDILCSVRAPVGRLNITLDKIIVGRGLAAILNKCGFQAFQYYQLCDHFVQEDMIGGGSIFNSVTKKELESQLMLVPESSVTSKFEASASIIDKQIENLHSQNLVLVEARDLLLPRLMSGRLPV